MSANTNVNAYTQDGRINQVEFAMKAMHLGTTTIAVRCNSSVVMVSEKKIINTLQDSDSVKKHFKIYDKIIAGCSGIITDAPTIINRCRNICINHESFYDEQIPVEILMENICGMALQFSESDYMKKIYSRPFGVSMLIGAFESGEAKLYSIDPSGSFVPYKACSIGSASEIVKTQLEKKYSTFNQTEDCVIELMKILKNVMKDKIEPSNVEITVLDKDGVNNFNKEAIEVLINKNF